MTICACELAAAVGADRERPDTDINDPAFIKAAHAKVYSAKSMIAGSTHEESFVIGVFLRDIESQPGISGPGKVLHPPHSGDRELATLPCTV
jgi:hypothetical protein